MSNPFLKSNSEPAASSPAVGGNPFMRSGAVSTASVDEADEYSGFRSGVATFVEGAVGAGDELDALLRRISGDADSWEEAIGQSRAEMKAFEEDNPSTATALNVTGIVAGLLVPTLGAAKIASATTKGAQIARAATMGAAEGAAYGFLSGEGEDRLSSAATGAALGGGIGAAAGKYLMKTQDELSAAAQKEAAKRSGQGTFIGGDEGFVKVGKIKEKGVAGIKKDTSLEQQVVKVIDENAVPTEVAEGGSGVFGNIALGLKEFTEKNVGVRAARLAEDAETMARSSRVAIDEVFESQPWQELGARIEADPRLKAITLRINPQRADAVQWDDVLVNNTYNLTDAQRADLKLLKDKFDELSALDPAKRANDYLPSAARNKIDTVIAGTDIPAGRPEDYFNPVDALRTYAHDVSDAAMLANRFGIGLDSVKVKNNSRLEGVIDAIRKEALNQGATKEVADNLRSVLRTQFVASRQGGASLGAVMRRATSVALLGNFSNALLNTAEGITAPIMQNGFKAWAKTVPDALISTFAPAVAGKSGRWLTDAASGHKGQYMGEIVSSGREAMTDTAEALNFIRLGREGREKLSAGVDKVGEAAFKVTGVSTVNRMGREILTNSAIKRGMDLAKKGKLDDLRKHDGMRGLTESEFQATVKALKDGDLESGWLRNFAGASLNKWQPVSASAMPKAFHDNPDARMLYSMLSYMNRQMNNIRTGVGLRLLDAKDKGINTKEGREALTDAYKFGAKYAVLFGVVNGFADQARFTIDASKDVEFQDVVEPDNLSERAIQQIVSNITSGLVNTKATDYGKGAFDFTPAPITAFQKVGGGLLSAAQGDPNELLKAAQTYVPVVSNVDRAVRSVTGERLLTGDPIAEVRDMIEGR